jgi:hypothetical protein
MGCPGCGRVYTPEEIKELIQQGKIGREGGAPRPGSVR